MRTRSGPEKRLAAERGCFVIADISGYTGYVVESPLEHAEDVLTDVTALVSEHLGQVLSLNKQEGDAIFGYALERSLDGAMLRDTIEECYFSFRNRLVGIERATSCDCNACAKLPELDLKFVVHAGDFIRRPVARGEELTGSAVIVAHRLLKNDVEEKG
jgi:class 3 adenylate cyclase